MSGIGNSIFIFFIPSRYSLLFECNDGWSPGQLENELKSNDWIISNADENLIFDDNYNNMWERAIEGIGFNINNLSNDSGLA